MPWVTPWVSGMALVVFVVNAAMNAPAMTLIVIVVVVVIVAVVEILAGGIPGIVIVDMKTIAVIPAHRRWCRGSPQDG